jgi:hypothetical protein
VPSIKLRHVNAAIRVCARIERDARSVRRNLTAGTQERQIRHIRESAALDDRAPVSSLPIHVAVKYDEHPVVVCPAHPRRRRDDNAGDDCNHPDGSPADWYSFAHGKTPIIEVGPRIGRPAPSVRADGIGTIQNTAAAES